jgi:hypothetical protein
MFFFPHNSRVFCSAMGFPSSSDPPTRIRSKNDAAVVGKLLKERHKGYFMIWNLSEESYDGAPFENQVMQWIRCSRTCSLLFSDSLKIPETGVRILVSWVSCASSRPHVQAVHQRGELVECRSE